MVVMRDDADFVSGLLEKLNKSAAVQEAFRHKEEVYAQLKYGLIALFFAIAKKERWKEAKESGLLKGAAQVVIQPNGWIRAYEGEANEPLDVKPTTLPFIVPGTGWKWENGECVAQPEYNWNVVGAVLYRPLYQPVREMVEGQISVIEAKAKPKKRETLLDAFIRELLSFAVEHCWNHPIVSEQVNKARKNKSGEFSKLTADQKRMEMRGLLLRLNEENLKKRRDNRAPDVPNLKMAETQMGRQWNSDEAYEALEADDQPKRRRTFRPNRGTANLEELANMLLVQNGSEDLVDLSDQYSGIEY